MPASMTTKGHRLKGVKVIGPQTRLEIAMERNPQSVVSIMSYRSAALI
mgnify:CR=1 FL=1